jgi:hypothetical protein
MPLNLLKPKMTEETKKYLRDNYNGDLIGFSQKLGINYNTLARNVYQMGLTRPRNKKGRIFSKEHIKHISESQIKLGQKPEIKLSRSVKQVETIKKYGHPKGMLGKHHTPEARKKMSIDRKGKPRKIGAVEKMQATEMLKYGKLNFTTAANSYSRCKRGIRLDIDPNIHFRSAWEANAARLLTFEGRKWEFEKKTFWFEKIRRGVRSYLPDFYLPDENIYIEVKGWMDARSKTKLKRMKKYYPDVVIEIWDGDFFKTCKRQGLDALIPNWE